MAGVGPIYTTPTGIGNWQDPALSQDPNAVSALNNIMGSYAPGTQFQHINDGGFIGALDNIIKGGAIIGGTLALPGVGSSLLGGASTAGPGAAAIGGSVGDIGAVVQSLTGGLTGAPGGLSSVFTGGGNYAPALDPTAGLSGAGIPGATGTFGAGAPITSGPGGLGFSGAALPAFDATGTLPTSAFNQSPPSWFSNPNNLKLAKNLLKTGYQMMGGQSQQQPGQQQSGLGLGTSGASGAGIGGLSNNLKMMLEANAQARMNGQQLPFPGLGGMGN